MPTIHREAGFRFGFRTADGTVRRGGELVERPHVHVVGHGGTMKVWLDDLSVAERWRLTDTDVKRALEIIGIRQAYMLGKWSEVFEA